MDYCKDLLWIVQGLSKFHRKAMQEFKRLGRVLEIDENDTDDFSEKNTFNSTYTHRHLQTPSTNGNDIESSYSTNKIERTSPISAKPKIHNPKSSKESEEYVSFGREKYQTQDNPPSNSHGKENYQLRSTSSTSMMKVQQNVVVDDKKVEHSEDEVNVDTRAIRGQAQ